MILGCMYFTKVAKSFFISADPISMACTLMVVERFCPLAGRDTMKRKSKNDVSIFFMVTDPSCYLTKSKMPRSILISILNKLRDILQHQLIAGRPLHRFCRERGVW